MTTQTNSSFAAHLAAKGIAVVGDEKMPVKGATAKTVSEIKADSLANLKLNKDAWIAGTQDKLIGTKTCCWKFINGRYNIGIKAGMRYLPNILGDKKHVIKNISSKDVFMSLFDELASGIEAGLFDDSFRLVVEANAK